MFLKLWPVSDDDPDLVSVTSDGCIREFRDRKLLRKRAPKLEKVTEIELCQTRTEGQVKFYALLHGEEQCSVIERRCLTVTKSFRNVSRIQCDDFSRNGVNIASMSMKNH